MPVLTGRAVAVGDEPAVAVQKIVIAVGNTSSAAFNARTRFVRLHTDDICSIKFGDVGSTAAITDARMAANSTEFFGTQGGQIVSNILNT